MRGSMHLRSSGSTISARTPIWRCSASVRSSVGRMAGDTPMSAPQRTKPEDPPTASPKRSNTASERSTISLVSRVG
jgi:hypothetical protein